MARQTLRPAPAHRTSSARHAPQSPSRWLIGLAVGSMTLLACVCTVPFPAGTGDMFLQILSGQYFWTHGFPRLDPFSYTASDHRWVEHEWLACLVFALLWHLGDVPAVVAWKTVVVGLTYWCTYQTARRLGARLSLVVLTWPLLVFFLSWRAYERAYLYSTLGLAVYGYLLTSVRQGQLQPRWLWLIPGVHVLWVNLHGGWVTGVGLLGCWPYRRERVTRPHLSGCASFYPFRTGTLSQKWPENRGIHVRRDTYIPQRFHASKATPFSGEHSRCF